MSGGKAGGGGLSSFGESSAACLPSGGSRLCPDLGFVALPLPSPSVPGIPVKGDEPADDSPVLAPKVDVWEKEDW